ncbi:tRNA (adenosine(37)-N6)-dimethylallyltransferase MiaA [Mangrovibrevibacter kandeliae]|uniref:tRNA (adenosine(37)-N6)-dimethylallyltransferase MiaA n=1 Tax=Mangrovibrevibacter kandeliae TaxID=2968473 RepID=UPI0021176F76|nr:tRNA (adenosine(37)-N6)-dimethylallyltransferase MiaA [Aurantimonas sp. CSK15Z-1]
MSERWSAILLAGPTASGKSRLALELAQRFAGTVINADSMQVYDGLSILTARPDEADLSAAPHRLYGHVDPASVYSAGAWLRDLEPVVAEVRAAGRLPILCGGTGLYFRAVAGGLDPMPVVPDEVRARWRARHEVEGSAALHAVLANRDAQAATRIGPSDAQRILRALELIEATGEPLSRVQTGAGTPLIDGERALKLVLAPDRAVLRRRIAERFAAMVAAGALEEVAEFRKRPGATTGGASRAIGLAELGAHLDGQIGLRDALERSITRTRQYAKRQETWFRHQLDASWRRLGDAWELATAELLRSP